MCNHLIKTTAVIATRKENYKAAAASKPGLQRLNRSRFLLSVG